MLAGNFGGGGEAGTAQMTDTRVRNLTAGTQIQMFQFGKRCQIGQTVVGDFGAAGEVNGF